MRALATRRRRDDLRCGIFSSMVPVIPEGARPTARVDYCTVTPEEAHFGNMMAALRPGGSVDHVDPGRYVRLYLVDARGRDQLVMSDTLMECRTNAEAVRDAHGDVLVGGLGIGLIVLPMLAKPEVTSVKVVERNADVIALVEPALRAAAPGKTWKKLAIECGDVDTWQPLDLASGVRSARTRRWDYIYFDIWPHVCADDYEHHVRLHKRYRRYLRPGGKVTSWRHDWLRYLWRMGR